MHQAGPLDPETMVGVIPARRWWSLEISASAYCQLRELGSGESELPIISADRAIPALRGVWWTQIPKEGATVTTRSSSQTALAFIDG
jgi:hypothetical protein